jgi:hypothetical protein
MDLTTSFSMDNKFTLYSCLLARILPTAVPVAPAPMMTMFCIFESILDEQLKKLDKTKIPLI